MKKTFFLVILSIICSILLVGCGFDSVSPTAEPTVARELFFDDAGAGVLTNKKIDFVAGDSTYYRGNVVGPAGIIKLTYTLSNDTNDYLEYNFALRYPVSTVSIVTSMKIFINSKEVCKQYHYLNKASQGPLESYDRLLNARGEVLDSLEGTSLTSNDIILSFFSEKLDVSEEVIIEVMVPY